MHIRRLFIRQTSQNGLNWSRKAVIFGRAVQAVAMTSRPKSVGPQGRRVCGCCRREVCVCPIKKLL